MGVGRQFEKVVQWLLPKERHFFDLIDEAALIAKEGGQHLVTLCCNSPDSREDPLAKILDSEKRSDRVTSRTFIALNKTFITPIDRSDIFSITHVFRKLSHAMSGTASQISLHSLDELPTGSSELALLIAEALTRIELGAKALNGMRNPLHIRTETEAVFEIERQGDQVFQTRLNELFAQETQAIQLIKKKEFLEGLEDVLDLCGEAAHSLNTVFVKNT